jgi:exonuclease SbcC
VRGEEQLHEREKNIDLLKKQKLDKEADNEVRKTQVSDIQEISLVKSWYQYTLDALTESRLLVIE